MSSLLCGKSSGCQLSTSLVLHVIIKTSSCMRYLLEDNRTSLLCSFTVIEVEKFTEL